MAKQQGGNGMTLWKIAVVTVFDTAIWYLMIIVFKASLGIQAITFVLMAIAGVSLFCLMDMADWKRKKKGDIK
jgi:hypothetical protein